MFKGVRRSVLMYSVILGLIGVLGGFAPASAQDGAAGCTPAKGAIPAGRSVQTIKSGGQDRTYVLHIPPGYDPAHRTPLVMSLHGLASNADQQAAVTRWHILAETANFVVVYPQGTSFPTRWNAGRFGIAGDDSTDDVQFFRDLITDLSRTLCIDPERIFVNGLSNGGGMANRLGCELADRIAAIGGVSGAYSDIPGGCKPSRPVPVVAFHGTADRIVPIDGSPGIGLPPIKDWAAGWAARNGCNAPPATILAKGEVGGLRYTGCKDNAEVIYYIIETGGHTWPGGLPFPFGIGGKVTKDIDATTTMWEFFKAHPLTLRK